MAKTHLRNVKLTTGRLAVAENIWHRGNGSEPLNGDQEDRFGFAGFPPGGVWPAKGLGDPLDQDVLADEE